MRKNLWLVVCLIFVFVIAACSRSEPKAPTTPVGSTNVPPVAAPVDGPPADVVQASAAEVELTPGGKAVAAVIVIIKPGYHINANPSSKFQIPTTLIVDAERGISGSAAIYPPGISKKFSFSPDSIVVYEKEIVIKQPLQATGETAKGGLSLHGKLKVQPCDDQVCYPPRVLPVSIPVIIK